MSSNLSDSVIHASNLGKRYVLGGLESQYDSFRELLMGLFSSPFKRLKKLQNSTDKSPLSKNESSQFWALKDVNFSVKRGEIVGVIGHNGAGKSTLLKVLTRITAPTEGEVKMTGRVASLLEVGTGFHPELTGRENIYLNGAILGMGKAEITEKFDEIVAFAEVEKFLDTPVKRYSSGMYVRLAFAVAAHLDVDILLVDEVLAVGDQEFQRRCFGKLNEVSEKGRTVLFVSHNLSAVAKLCDRALVMDNGSLAFDGDIKEGIAFYTQQTSAVEALSSDTFTGDLFPDVSFEEFSINSKVMQQGVEVDPLKPTQFVVKGDCQIEQSGFKVVLSIRKEGQLVFSLYDGEGDDSLPKGKFESSFEIPEKFLTPGEYSFSIGGANQNTSQWLWTPDYRFIVAHRWESNYNTTSSVLGVINVEKFGKRKVRS